MHKNTYLKNNFNLFLLKFLIFKFGKTFFQIKKAIC